MLESEGEKVENQQDQIEKNKIPQRVILLVGIG